MQPDDEFEPEMWPRPPVKVHKPWMSPLTGRHEVVVTVDPATLVIEANRRRPWGRALAAIASEDPRLVTTRHHSRFYLDDPVDEDERQAWVDRTEQTLTREALKERYTIVAFGSLQHVPSPMFPGPNPLMMWERHALAIKLVSGWERTEW